MVRGRLKSRQLTRDSKSNTSSNNDSIPNYAKTLFTAGLGGLSDALMVQDEIPGQVPMQPKRCSCFGLIRIRTHQLRVAAKSLGLALAGRPCL
jgi:hypothetical protein